MIRQRGYVDIEPGLNVGESPDAKCRRPLLLDLYCGAGGASRGYYNAGFDVIGVDHVEQPRYPYQFIRADAKDFLTNYDLSVFDAVHASPPCQQYSALNYVVKGTYADDIAKIRFLLVQTELPYVIENVPLAPLREPVMLCGTMFDLKLIRHRLFETNFKIETPGHKSHHKQKEYRRDHARVYGSGYKIDDGRHSMGIDWMVKKELSQAIPPIYTEYIGLQMLDVIRQREYVDSPG